jgi:hypothetical protein
MRAHWHAQRLIGPVHRRQSNAGTARAQNDRCHYDVQAVETTGGQKARNGIGASLDKHTMHPASGQGRKDYGRSKTALDCG